MVKYSQKQLREMVASGAAMNITNEMDKRTAVPEHYTKIGYAAGLNGFSGLLLRGEDPGKLYAVTRRTSAIDLY